MDDIEYLKKLYDELWENKTIFPTRSFYSKERRIILFNELEKICEILNKKNNNIYFEIHNDCMGFGIGMTISHLSHKATKLLHINQKHFSPNNHFDDAWPIFKQLAECFKHKLLEPLREKSYYEY